MAFTLCLTHIYNYYTLVKNKNGSKGMTVSTGEPGLSTHCVTRTQGHFRTVPVKYTLSPSFHSFLSWKEPRQTACCLAHPTWGMEEEPSLNEEQKTLTGLPAVILTELGLGLHPRVIRGCFVKEK